MRPAGLSGAVAVRTVFVLHGTWAVNSLSHVFGYRTYETREGSPTIGWSRCGATEKVGTIITTPSPAVLHTVTIGGNLICPGGSSK